MKFDTRTSPLHCTATMSQIVRIQNKFLHIPSLARVRLSETSFLGRPMLVLQEQNGDYIHVIYRLSAWDKAIYDYKKIQTSITSCQEALKRVPWMEEPVAQNPLVESEIPLQMK